ncbi:hypothetical protein O9H85_24275 [Paenibacillus filicis]|uniref:Chloramphenicol phosphotransferase n=1 Tax=Paenibacillus gyeongsangnamensis TaxID=3388067 RepID=A0ABT4QF08_9BACL|nr:hypothetical protein [Paenibacillus filicis]MCZ8515464.1 hypothetical protein [Paenibacillus filicis]
MPHEDKLGQIVILNGNPRAGKSSIATAIQNTFEGVWMNEGGSQFKKMTPERVPILRNSTTTMYCTPFQSI